MQTFNNSTGDKSSSRELKDYTELIDTICKIEYSKFSYYIIEFAELVSIASTAVHLILTSEKVEHVNKSYLSTAIKWAIRNELRRRYKWYSAKQKQCKEANYDNENEIDCESDIRKEEVREAVYETILSIDNLAEADNPRQIKDSALTPEEVVEFNELNRAIKLAITKLPKRERIIIESRFYKDMKVKEIAEEQRLTASRITRIIQTALNKVKKELKKDDLFEDVSFQ